MASIKNISAIEVLSGSGRPTVEVELATSEGVQATASVPCGTSTGKYESKTLYDGGRRYRGFGVQKAVSNVNDVIAPKLIGMDVTAQSDIDNLMIELDGTPTKENLGGNSILAVSLAVAKAGADTCGLPLYRYLGGIGSNRLPVPLATVLAGGHYSPSSLDFEDYLISLDHFERFSDALEALSDIHATLGALLKDKYGDIPDVGGAYAPPMKTNEEAFDTILEAAERAGYGKKVSLGLDVVGSDLFKASNNRYRISGKELTAESYMNYFVELAKKYPLNYIEDPFHEDDFDSHSKLSALLPNRKIVGDDLFVSNSDRLTMGISKKSCNALLLKVNQVGTLTEAYKTALLALRQKLTITVSLRSSDTNDSFIADLAVSIGADQIKLGGPVRGERNAKYNRLLRIEKELGSDAAFAGQLRIE
jgi:enolase